MHATVRVGGGGTAAFEISVQSIHEAIRRQAVGPRGAGELDHDVVGGFACWRLAGGDSGLSPEPRCAAPSCEAIRGAYSALSGSAGGCAGDALGSRTFASNRVRARCKRGRVRRPPWDLGPFARQGPPFEFSNLSGVR